MSVADFETARETILTRFKEQWDILHPETSGSRDVPIVWPNVPFDPETQFNENSQYGWVRIDVLPGESFQASISGSVMRWRTPGVIMVGIFVPQGTGDQKAVQIADDVVAALRGVTVSGVVLSAASVQVVGVEDQWYHLNVTVRFRYDTLTS